MFTVWFIVWLHFVNLFYWSDDDDDDDDDEMRCARHICHLVKLIGFILFENLRCWCNFDDHEERNIISVREIQCGIFYLNS